MSEMKTARKVPGRAGLAASGVVLALVLSACGGGGADSGGAEAGSGTGAITVWAHQGQDAENAALQRAVKGFNSSQSEIKVSLKLLPTETYTSTVQATKASGMPDVLEMDGPTMASYVYNNKISPIEDYVSVKTLSNQTEAAVNEGTYQGKRYGLAMYDSSVGLYADKKLLEKAGVSVPSGGKGWSAEQFTSVLKKLAAVTPGGKAMTAVGFGSEGGTYRYSPVVWSAGGDLLKDSKATGVLDSAPVVEAMKTFASWKPYVDPDADGNAFPKGRVALSWNGHWVYPTYKEALGDRLTVVPLPDFGHGSKAGAGSWEWGISRSSKNAAAAGKFLDYLLGDANVKAMTDANGAPPATRSVAAESTLYRKGGALSVFADNLAAPCTSGAVDDACRAVTRPVTPGYPVITSSFSQALLNIWGGADPETELRKAATVIDTDFADNADYQ
ncbi:ABC transporter substrate-binding protein [Streptomyces sp. NPDC093591]|uniref:ABC transporter substrate-binding protein n=1 Tax=Streptomyces sp. NPDC093591 TaxID=3366044 RepID=UPI003802F67E